MDAKPEEHASAEKRRRKHKLYWRKLWFVLFVAATVAAAIFAYAWWQTDQELRDLARSIKEERVLTR